MADVCEIKVGFKEVTLATRIIQGVWTTSTRILFNQERIMATITNFGSEIEQFEMDVDKSSLAAGWLEWKSSASYMIKGKKSLPRSKRKQHFYTPPEGSYKRFMELCQSQRDLQRMLMFTTRR